MLSRRILYWSRDALFWECTALKASEAHPDGNASYTDFHSHDMVFPNLNFSRIFRLSEAESLSTYWLDLVHHYSAMNFSYDSDRPIALQGLVELLQNRFSDTYVHGIWLPQLFRGILWRSVSVGRKVVSPRYPSWSWMSTTAAVKFPLEFGQTFASRLEDDKQYAQILSVDSSSDFEADGREMLFKQRDRLHIKGAFDKININTENNTIYVLGPTDFEWKDDRGPWVVLGFDTEQSVPSSLAKSHADVSRGTPETDQGSQISRSQDQSFEIMIVGRTVDESDGLNQIYGLILQQKERNKFIRIGMATVDVESEALCKKMISSLPEKTIVLV